jgi:glutathione S-transferase
MATTTRTALKGGYYPGITLPHNEPVELYHNSLSNCSQKVRICLAEKGVAYRSNHVHLIETGSYETCAPSYKAINPGATVPTLVHEGHPVYESSDQILYIDKTFGTAHSLTPLGMEEEIAKWVKFTSITAESMSQKTLGAGMVGISLLLFVTMIEDIPYGNILWGLRHHPNKERPLIFILFKLLGPFVFRIPMLANIMVRNSREQLRKHLRNLEEDQLKDGRKYLCGNEFTLADVGLMACFARMQLADCVFLWKDDLPLVKAYFSRLEERPSYQVAIRDASLPIMERGASKIKQLKKTRPWFQRMAEGAPMVPPQEQESNSKEKQR